MPSTANEPDRTSSPTARTTGRDSPLRIASSNSRPVASATTPSATTWSPAVSRTRSPSTTSSTCSRSSAPSRTTVANGATSAASASSFFLARSSWPMPTPAFATTIPTKSASLASPKISVTSPSESRIALNGVATFARTMLAVERLDACGSTAPRAWSRARASAAVRPTGAASAVTAHPASHARSSRRSRRSRAGARRSRPPSRASRKAAPAAPARIALRAAPA